MLRALISLGAALAVFAPRSEAKSPFPERPRLILFVAVDQLRADYLMRFYDRFGPGGFRHLMSKGAYYPYAEYDILQCATGPGHATMLTGSYPYQAGIPINDWYDSSRGGRVYCAQDENHKLVGAEQKKVHAGTSPRNLFGSTVGDELKNAGYSSKVVSIALKDRAAIMMGGHRADLALWMNDSAFRWVSSSYYLPGRALPKWVEELNAGLEARRGQALTWKPEGKPTGYTLADSSPYMIEWVAKAVGGPFPHVTKMGDSFALSGPLGLQVTTDAALAAAREYGLGADSGTDLLAVSYSAFDYVGHGFGPNSLEMEDLTVRLDRELARLFEGIDDQVPGGLREVVIALTADHGVSPAPKWLAANRVAAGAEDTKELEDKVEARLRSKFGKGGEGNWIGWSDDGNFFFDPAKARRAGVEIARLEAEAKAYLAPMPWVAQVFTATELASGRKLPGLPGRQLELTYFPGRMGNVVVVPRPFHAVSDATATHMTCYSYDRTVPLAIAGRGIKPGTRAEIAKVVDLAPTLTFLSGTVPPALSEGRPLSALK